MEQFGYTLQNSQEVLGDSHEAPYSGGLLASMWRGAREGASGEKTYVREHYVRLHFVRDLASPDLEIFRELERKNFPHRSSSPSSGAGTGCTGRLIIATAFVVVVCACVVVALHMLTHEPDPGVAVNTTPTNQQKPLGDATPWVTNDRILSSFPADVPPPSFVGAFAGGAGDTTYELHLWSDRKGAFGELLSPVMEVDSPTSRLYEPRYDRASGELRFRAKFGSSTLDFLGVLKGGTISGMTTIDGKYEKQISLRKLASSEVHGVDATSYTSRSQFERAMDLFHRY